jgi:hypothetical protein
LKARPRYYAGVKGKFNDKGEIVDVVTKATLTKFAEAFKLVEHN